MALWLLRNFRAKAPPSSPTQFDIKDLLSYLYAFLEVWNFFLVRLLKLWEDDVLGHSPQRPCKATTTTTKLFGQVCTLDIPSSEFPSLEEIYRMEKAMPEECRHGWFPSVTGHQLHYRYFLPKQQSQSQQQQQQQQQQPKAIIIWMHGLQGSGGEAHVLKTGERTNMALQAEAYLKEGYAVYALDMLGHGWSEGKRWFMPNGEIMLADYIRFVQGVAQLHQTNKSSRRNHNNTHENFDQAEIPIFLSGYSYGGSLTIRAASYFQTYPKDAPKNFQGILLQAPAIYDLDCFFLYPILEWLTRKIINPILGDSFCPPKWMPNRVHPRRFWRNRERYQVGMTLNGMNAAGRHIPMRTCLTLMQDMGIVRNESIPRLSVPFCVVHGEKDVVVPVKGSEYLLRASLTPRSDQAFKFFPQAYHDMLAEPEANEVMYFQINWIKRRLAIPEKKNIELTPVHNSTKIEEKHCVIDHS